MYHNEMYNIFDQNYVMEQLRQLKVQQSIQQKTLKNMHGYDNDQMCKVAECVQKLDDFLESTKEVSPEYQGIAAVQCWMVLEMYMNKK